MTLAAAYRRAITARRAFRLPGYLTLADLGFDGDYVSPIQMSSGALDGPLLISKDWLDAPSAARHAPVLERAGYLPGMTYNRVIDRALALIGLTRAQVYITPIFHLLTQRRSAPIPAGHVRASFDAVGRHELLGRRPVALGQDSARALAHFGVDHVAAPHPSARTSSIDDRARVIADAMRAA